MVNLLKYILIGMIVMSMHAYSLEHSEVFTLHSPKDFEKSKSLMEAYKVDVIGWGDSQDPNLEALKESGIRYQMTLSAGIWGGATLENPNSYDGKKVCLSLDGRRITGAGTGFTYKVYRMCGNKIGWNDYWLAKMAKSQKFSGYQMDCPIGSNGQYYCFLMDEGCYCNACVKEFRNYLKKKYSAEELKAKGVKNIETYNQRYHTKQAVGKGDFASALKAGRVKFGKDYLLFQMKTGMKVGKHMAKIIRENHPDAVISANAWHMSPYNMYSADFADYFFGETEMHAGKWSTKTISHSLARVLKLSDAMGKDYAVIPSIDDMKTLKKKGFKNINEQKLWIAACYALGGFYTAPIEYRWAGQPNYKGDLEDYAGMFTFIKDNKHLFDKYEEYNEGIALIYDNAAYFQSFGQVKLGSDEYREQFDEMNAYLWNKNIQYSLVIAGDENFYTHKLSKSKIDKYETVINPSKSWLVDGQKEIVKGYEQSKTINGLADLQKVIADYKPAVDVGSSRVWVNVRKHQSSGDLAIHLLSKNHNPYTDVSKAPKNIELKVHKDLLVNKKIKNIAVYSPVQMSQNLEFKIDENQLSVFIDKVNLWSVVHIEFERN